MIDQKNEAIKELKILPAPASAVESHCSHFIPEKPHDSLSISIWSDTYIVTGCLGINQEYYSWCTNLKCCTS